MEHFMGYQINFNGAVTPELGQLLHAVEKQLNWHGIHAQGGDMASSASSTGAPGGVNPDTHGLHDPNVVVVGGVALVVGFVVGYVVGKSSASSSSKSSGGAQ
jgi:hypothetical protein